eukprot:scaffold29333_cov73-Isochrysis_galbana.AAC.1
MSTSVCTFGGRLEGKSNRRVPVPLRDSTRSSGCGGTSAPPAGAEGPPSRGLPLREPPPPRASESSTVSPRAISSPDSASAPSAWAREKPISMSWRAAAVGAAAPPPGGPAGPRASKGLPVAAPCGAWERRPGCGEAWSGWSCGLFREARIWPCSSARSRCRSVALDCSASRRSTAEA